MRARPKTNGLLMSRNQNGIISIDGLQPWFCIEDIQHRTNVLMDYDYVIIGHNTFKIFGVPPAHLSKHIVVLTNQLIMSTAKHVSFHNIRDVHSLMLGGHRCLVAGGKQTFETLIDLVDEVFITTVTESPKYFINELEVIRYNPDLADFQCHRRDRLATCVIDWYRRIHA